MTRIRILFVIAMGSFALALGPDSLAAPAGGQNELLAAAGPTVTTKHTVKMGGRLIHYTAVAGKIVLQNDSGKPAASMSYIAYTEGGAAKSQRPVTFVWGGGLGATSTGLQAFYEEFR